MKTLATHPEFDINTVDQDNNTILSIAVQCGNLEQVRWIIAQRNVQLNLPNVRALEIIKNLE